MTPLVRNRSVPEATVIPELPYPDVLAAADWLCAAFGFTVRLRIAEHRVQLVYGDGAVVVVQGDDTGAASVLVRVEDVDSHSRQAASAGARIVHLPTDYPYGERQYTAEDSAGRRWTFSQSIADVDPAEWGGELGEDL
jgi:uncharacterized glyoxalase superfamily protein PhnB